MLTRAVEICQATRAHVRFEGGDLVFRPAFARSIDTLDFDARRVSVAAGVKAVRKTVRVEAAARPEVPIGLGPMSLMPPRRLPSGRECEYRSILGIEYAARENDARAVTAPARPKGAT